MWRIVLLILAFTPSEAICDLPKLPTTPPPFSLADACVVRSNELDGTLAVTFDYFGGRGTSLDRGYVHSGFAHSVTLSHTDKIASIRVWDRDGNELTSEQIAQRTKRPTKGVIMTRPKEDGFLAYSQLLDADTIFVLPSKRFLTSSHLHPFKYVPLPIPTLPDPQ